MDEADIRRPRCRSTLRHTRLSHRTSHLRSSEKRLDSISISCRLSLSMWSRRNVWNVISTSRRNGIKQSSRKALRYKDTFATCAVPIQVIYSACMCRVQSTVYRSTYSSVSWTKSSIHSSTVSSAPPDSALSNSLPRAFRSESNLSTFLFRQAFHSATSRSR